MTAAAIAAGFAVLAVAAFTVSRRRSDEAFDERDARATAVFVGTVAALGEREQRQVASDPGLFLGLHRARFQPRQGYPVGIVVSFLALAVALVAAVITQATA